jgi:hypothetical protein
VPEAEVLITEALDRELNKPLAEDVKENHFNIRQAFDGMMLDKWLKQNAEVLGLAKQTREGTLGQSAKPGEPDDMGVSIGNKTFHITPTPAQAAPAGMSTLAKVGVGAALTAAGVGLPAIGAATYALLDKDLPAVVAPVNPGTDKDSDTYLEYDFGIE